MVPSPDPRRLAHRPEIAESISKAQRLAAQGQADTPSSFLDVNIGRPFSVTTTPHIYLSVFAPDSPGLIVLNVSHLKAPILWVAASGDPSQTGASDIFSKAPPSSSNRYVTVSASHLGALDAAQGAVLAWLRDLTGH
jgi:hypothetical protein